jgi:hypothetical protein
LLAVAARSAARHPSAARPWFGSAGAARHARARRTRWHREPCR